MLLQALEIRCPRLLEFVAFGLYCFPVRIELANEVLQVTNSTLQLCKLCSLVFEFRRLLSVRCGKRGVGTRQRRNPCIASGNIALIALAACLQSAIQEFQPVGCLCLLLFKGGDARRLG